MLSRLVLGCGGVGHALVDELASREGELHVLESDPSRIETLRTEKVAATRADVTNATEVAAAGPADIVIVAGDDPTANRRAVVAAREALPEAYLIAYPGEDATRDHLRAIEAEADRLIDPGATIVDTVDEAVAEGARDRVRRLRRTLQDVDGTLGVFTHDNPDPDAIASAVALCRVAATLGVDAEACYYGEISHQENRAFVNLLDLDLRSVDPGDPVEYGGIALVDHSRPGVNDQLPPETEVDIVIDHHPAEEPFDARFVDHRESAGATSTLLVDYVKGFGVDPEGAVATGLLYGIRVDTKDFSREITPEDFEAAAYLLPHADASVLEQVESPNVSADTFDTIARAIRNRELDGSTLVSCVGSITDRDTLSQAADRLLGMEGVTTTLVCGFTEGTIYISARSREPSIDLGTVLRDSFGEMGSAGGHADMAGAQIPLGLFGEIENQAEESLAGIIRNVVTERFFAAMRG